MKICPQCRAEVEDHFDLCWKCNYSFSIKKVVQIQDERESDLECLRCKTPMFYEGDYNIRVGILPETWKNMDLYTCPNCGKVEFFLPWEEVEKRKRITENLNK